MQAKDHSSESAGMEVGKDGCWCGGCLATWQCQHGNAKFMFPSQNNFRVPFHSQHSVCALVSQRHTRRRPPPTRTAGTRSPSGHSDTRCLISLVPLKPCCPRPLPDEFAGFNLGPLSHGPGPRLCTARPLAIRLAISPYISSQQPFDPHLPYRNAAAPQQRPLHLSVSACVSGPRVYVPIRLDPHVRTRVRLNAHSPSCRVRAPVVL
jgi:hypothetical protein